MQPSQPPVQTQPAPNYPPPAYTRQYIGTGFHIKHGIAIFFTLGLWYPIYRWALKRKRRPITVTTYGH